ncbi:MAG: hypothetical protein E2O39_13670, partial [Planctomycetota bacterium]
MNNTTRNANAVGTSASFGRLCLAGALLALAGGAGCGSGSSPHGGSNPQGQILENPAGGIFIVDANNSGVGQRVRLVRTAWGRLVNVFSAEADGSIQLRSQNFVIGDDIESDLQDYRLVRNAVTGEENLTILHPYDLTPGTEYWMAFTQLDANLNPIFDNGLGGAGIFSMVPRNSAVILQFDDLLDPDLVSSETIHVLTGLPTTIPFEGRIFIDPNHGDLADFEGDDEPEFYSTRAIIDTTVTELEAFNSDPPLPLNGVGFPASLNVSTSNVAIRIPTRIDPIALQEFLVRNPSGHPLSNTGNGTVDFSTSTEDVVRLMRSGGNQEITGDPFNGFLKDEEFPEVIGTQAVTILSIEPVDPVNEPTKFVLVGMQFQSQFCAQTPSLGDIIRQSGVFAEVTALSAPQQDGLVQNLEVRLLLWPVQWTSPQQWLTSAVGGAQFLSAFQPGADSGKESCFIRIVSNIPPTGAPNNPTGGIATNSAFLVRFSEPMDPTSLTAFDSLTLTRRPVPTSLLDDPLSTSDFVVGRVSQSLDLQEFTFNPDLDLAHSGVGGPNGPTEERYYLNLADGDQGPTDLAGNEILLSLPEVIAIIEVTQPTQINGGRVARFTSADEEPPFGDDFGPKPEWTGQHLYDILRQLIRPRPVLHFSVLADRNQLVPAIMSPIAGGVQTPLSNLGSKMQTVWRYADVGFSLEDTTNYNVDVEGLNWSPIGGQVIADNYAEFEIRLSHAKVLPDEYIDPASLFPKWFNSGLKPQFLSNPLQEQSPLQVVSHPKILGYTVSPGDLFADPGGTLLMPFPLNRTLPQSEFRYYTWRDTAILKRGGNQNGGAEFWQNLVATGGQLPPFVNPGMVTLQTYGSGQIPTAGLPLLMEFRCYPDDDSIGLNSFDISIATNSSARPYFRAWSTGGTDQGGNVVRVDPDIETHANGGFNPTSAPPGAGLPGQDPVFYIGAMDLVVRVSRSYSLWFETLGPLADDIPTVIASPTYSRPVLEPRAEDQPQGTEIALAFRGAGSVIPLDPQQNASTLDGYGDYYDSSLAGLVTFPRGIHDSEFANVGIAFSLDDADWHAYPAPDDSGATFAVDGSQFYQIRISFLSNTETGLTPELSALALSWT